MRDKYSKGFTLIELMLVISIIIIIAGFIFPKFIGYEEKAKKVKALNTAHQIYTATMSTYSYGSASLSESDIAASVEGLTGTNVTVKNNAKTDTMDITYDSDSKSYTVSINILSGGYTVSNNAQILFTQN